MTDSDKVTLALFGGGLDRASAAFSIATVEAGAREYFNVHGLRKAQLRKV